MKIKRTINGATEWLVSDPISVLADDGVTIDHVETVWTSDESHAKDFTARVPTAQHARDIAAQLDGMGAEFPAEWIALPEPAPIVAPPAPVPPPVRVETRVTPAGQARRDVVDTLKAQADQHAADADVVVAMAEAAAPEDAPAVAVEADAVVAAATETAAAADAVSAREAAQVARDAAARAEAAKGKAEAAGDTPL